MPHKSGRRDYKDTAGHKKPKLTKAERIKRQRTAMSRGG